MSQIAQSKIKPIRWLGGKGNMVKKILPYLISIPHRIYVEPYCGGASLLFAKPPSQVEVINNLDEHLINFFRVMQDPEQFEELKHKLTWTMYAKKEYEKALFVLNENNEHKPSEKAWALFVAQNMAFSSVHYAKASVGNWARRFSNSIAKEFVSKLEKLNFFRDRLREVYIDCSDALHCIKYWDSADTLFYLDPPYFPTTRSKDARSKYKYEADEAHHNKLVDVLLNIKGQAVLSGYHNETYQKLVNSGWKKVDFNTFCHAVVKSRQLQKQNNYLEKTPRTESIYIKANSNFTLYES